MLQTFRWETGGTVVAGTLTAVGDANLPHDIKHINRVVIASDVPACRRTERIMETGDPMECEDALLDDGYCAVRCGF